MDHTRAALSNLVLAICLTFIFCTAVHPGQNEQSTGLSQKKILLLHSYHQGYLWTDEITRGVRESLKKDGVDIHIEYMDTKRQFKFSLLSSMADVLKIKHAKHQYDVIICSDDNAFNFIKDWRENIFKGIPVVFCGVNYLDDDHLKGLSGYTGINEKMDIQGNIELIKAIHPDLDKIVVIVDDTTTGRQNQREVRRIAALPENRHINVQLLYDVSMDELILSAKTLETGTVALFTIFIRDNKDHFLEYEQVLAQVADTISVPLYATQNFTQGLPVVGGCLTNGFDQGAEAARKARQILLGTPVSMVPVSWETPTHPRFDFRLLKRHGIDLKKLPPGSQIINQPVSFYEQNKLVIEITALAFVLLLISFLGVSFGFLKSRRAEKKIADSERKYRRLFENAPSGMYEMDLITRRFTNANASMCKLSGYSKDEFLSMDLFDLLAAESRPLYLQRLEKISSGDLDLSKSIEYQMLRKDGQTRDVVLNIDFFSESEKIVGARVVVHDITERKQIEELMIQSEKMMSIGGLAAGMAHEINNPLAGMMQNAQVIHNRLSTHLPANEKAAVESGTTMDSIRTFMEKRKILSQLENINTAGIRAAKIVNNMLSFARKNDSVKKQNNVYQLVDDALDLAGSDYNLAKKYDFKSIAITKEYDPDLPVIYCEKTKIEQVLLNILKNCAEAMAEENGQSKIPALRIGLYKEKNFLCIEIEDNGPGMEDETRKRIFEPFFTTKSVDQGTGLGLSVSYFIIVNDHKGKMDVKSKPGEGSRFTIHLPISQE